MLDFLLTTQIRVAVRCIILHSLVASAIRDVLCSIVCGSTIVFWWTQSYVTVQFNVDA